MATDDSLLVDNVNDAPAISVVPVDFNGPLPKPTLSMDEAKADLDRAGFGIVVDVLSAEVVRATRQVLTDEIAREEAIDESRVHRFEMKGLDPDDTNRRLKRLPDRHHLFRSLLEHPVVLDLTKYILGPTMLNESYLVHSYDANVTRPGGREQHLHLDRTKPHDGYAAPLQSRFILCLDNFDAENGATRVVPGSHMWNDRIDRTGMTYYESVPAEAPAGSLIVYTDMVLHGTGANVSSDRERASLNFGYCPPWCRPTINYPLSLDLKAMEGSSRTLRQLLGYTVTMAGCEEPWDGASEQLRALCVSPTMDW